MTTKITWYGHAALAIVTDNLRLLIDPFLKGNPKAAISPDIVEADYILITHGHGDHFGDSVTIAKRTGASIICNSEIARWLGSAWHKSTCPTTRRRGTLPLRLFEDDLRGTWFGLVDGSYAGLAAGYLLATKDGNKIYIAGDTALSSDMQLIGEEGIDLAILPIGDTYTMGPADALRAVSLLKPRQVIPVHYNTWDFINQDAAAWAIDVEQNTKTNAIVLSPGASHTLN